jgi:glycerol-3-phosphate O-acyltransferase
LAGLSDERDSSLVQRLAMRLTSEIKEAVPILTTPLILAALFALGGRGNIAEIGAKMATLLDAVPTQVPRDAVEPSDEAALKEEVDVLVLRQILSLQGDVYSVLATNLAIYYANSIRHHLAADAAEAIPHEAPENASAAT